MYDPNLATDLGANAELSDAELEDYAEDEETVVQAVTGQSDYDNVYAAIARKSMARARMLDENPMIARAVKKMMIGIELFARLHHCSPQDLTVKAKLTADGHVVVSMRRA